MRRRFALQILATSAFGSAAVTAAGSTSNDLTLKDHFATAELQSVLTGIHHDASYLRDVSAGELKDVLTDVAFFAREAHSRVASASFETPAFWQSCHDRFLNATALLTSRSLARSHQERLLRRLEQCLPLLRRTLQRTLAG